MVKYFRTMTAPTPEIQTVFELENIWFRYDRSTPDFLFRDLSLTIALGESVALIGPSGEGKSTLLRLMTGLVTPERGRIRFFGQPFAELSTSQRTSLMRRIGMTFQNSGLFDSLSCGDNLRFPLEEAGVKEGIRERVRATLETVGLTGIDGLRTHQISGGMRKRLGIARAHILSPQVVLYDEPTAGLDPLTSRAIVDLILKLKREEKVTVIVVSNDPLQAFQMADRILFIQEGKILEAGNPAALRASPKPEVKAFLNAFVGGSP